MCALYEIAASRQKLLVALGLSGGLLTQPHPAARPTDTLPLILQEAPDLLALGRWGLVPAWAQDVNIGQKMINARAETLALKPSFAPLIARQRCLIPATAFTEWQTGQQQELPKHGTRAKKALKIPLRICPVRLDALEPADQIFTMAGLYTRWQDPATGQPLLSYTLITTAASAQMAPIHERMPVILPQELRALWLGADTDKTALAHLLAHPPHLQLHMQPYTDALPKIASSSRHTGGQLPLFM